VASLPLAELNNYGPVRDSNPETEGDVERTKSLKVDNRPRIESIGTAVPCGVTNLVGAASVLPPFANTG
jgi:hypothetical protein